MIEQLKPCPFCGNDADADSEILEEDFENGAAEIFHCDGSLH